MNLDPDLEIWRRRRRPRQRARETRRPNETASKHQASLLPAAKLGGADLAAQGRVRFNIWPDSLKAALDLDLAIQLAALLSMRLALIHC